MTMMSDTKKSINVVAALIEQDGKVFAAQRAYGELKGKWELPGGKIENGETPQEALKREIKEELDTEIEVGGFFMHIDYEYPTFFLHMDVFRATPLKGRLQIEAGIHSDEGFFAISELIRLDWCPADCLVLEKLTFDRP